MRCMRYPIKQFAQRVPQTIHIRGPTIEMDDGPQGPGTKGVNSLGMAPASQNKIESLGKLISNLN